MNNAGAALMPLPVVRAVEEHLQLETEIGGYEAAAAREEAIESTYADLATIVACAPRNIAIVANATAGFIQALSTIDFAPGDAIVTSRSDYTSNQIQYLALCKRLGVRVVHAADLPEGGIDPDAVRRAIAEARAHGTCRLVAVSWVPTTSGLVQDVASVGRVCEDLGVTYLIDACQAVGQLPVDVDDLRCDYLSATSRKFLRGPRGIGFMFISDRALARGDYPLYVDMRGARWTADTDFEIADTARRFEDWEFPYALVLGQGAAARYARAIGIHIAQRRSWSLAERLRIGLAGVPAVRVLDRGLNRCAIVTARLEAGDIRLLIRALHERRINAVLSLFEFGRYDFADKRTDTAIRLSPHYYNTEQEIDEVVETVRDFVTREVSAQAHS